MMTLQEIVIMRLKELKLGAVEAAVQAGIERSYIRDIEKGRKTSVRADKLEGLARALFLEPAALARNEMVRIGHETKTESLDAQVRHILPPDEDPDDYDAFVEDVIALAKSRAERRSHKN